MIVLLNTSGNVNQRARGGKTILSGSAGPGLQDALNNGNRRAQDHKLLVIEWDGHQGSKAIIPWLPQLAPPGNVVSARVSTAPPPTGAFLSLLPTKNPSHWPSGEKNGSVAPSVPGMSLASRLSIARR